MSDEEIDSRNSPVPEKCFYASFKIFLNPDSRKNSKSGSEDLGTFGAFSECYFKICVQFR